MICEIDQFLGFFNTLKKMHGDGVSIMIETLYESIATVGEIQVWWRADFQSGSRVLKKVF